MSHSRVGLCVVVASFFFAVSWVGVGCGGTDSGVNGGADGDSGSVGDGTTTDSGNSGADGSSKDGSSGGDGAAACGTACTAFADGGAFPVFDDKATSVDNCASVKLHEVDSCGTVVAISFNHGFTDDFNNAEAAWRASCGSGTGTPGPTLAEDGKTVPADELLDGGVAVQCINPDGGTCECETYVP